MGTWKSDTLQAIRSLRKQPTFTLTAILTLALGIGATAAIFSVVDAVLLRPLPYRESDRLVHVAHDLQARKVEDFPFAPGDFYDLRNLTSPFEQVEAVQTFRPTFAGDGAGRATEQVPAAQVTVGFFRLLGMTIEHGRDFTAADGTPLGPPPGQAAQGAPPQGGRAGQAGPAGPGAQGGRAAGPGAAAAPAAQPAAPQPPPPPQTVILSHEFWQRRFGGDTAVVGTVQELGAQRFEIVGVLSPGAELLFPPNVNIERTPQIWISNRQDFANGSRINVSLRVIGRLKPGIELTQAQSEIDRLTADLRKRFPIKETAGFHLRLAPMKQDLVAEVRTVIWTLMGAVAFVLLIACANVANLMLIRTAARERDLAVRAALGGSRGRLIRQLLVEGLVLSLTASALGLLLAQGAIVGLRALAPDNVPRLDHVAIDPRVVSFGIGLSILSVLLFGLLPAIRASRPNVMDVLRRTGRSESLGQGKWIRNSVVVVEVALSFVLLIGSGLMVRSFVSLYQASPGFDPAGILTFRLTNQGQAAPSFEARQALARDLKGRLEALPGVTAVTSTSFLPLGGGQEPLVRYGREDALADASKFQQGNSIQVPLNYFEVMRTPFVDGRMFTAEENLQQPNTVIIDTVLAQKMFPGQRAVGQRLYARTVRNEPDPYEIIGVVGHQRQSSPAVDGRERIYFPEAFGGGGVLAQWVIRTTGDPTALEAAMRREVTAISPRLGVFEVRTMPQLMDEAAAGTRFVLWLLSLFAGVAMVMAAVGLYSVLSTAVRQRTAEIGVRMAFGATTRSIFGLIVGQGLVLSIIGVVIGALSASLLTNAISGMLVGVSATDPLTYSAIGAAFLLVAVIACAAPAFRASRLDPLSALRQE
jgi:putative ABC transport system permease protein